MDFFDNGGARIASLVLFAFVGMLATGTGAISLACPDGNQDGLVDISDLGLYAETQGVCEGNETFNPTYDLDGDRCVGDTASLDFVCLQKYQLAGTCAANIACTCHHGHSDLNHDGITDVSDLGHFAQSAGKCAGGEGFNPEADFNGDGCVGKQNSIDLYCLKSNYSTTPTLQPTQEPTAEPSPQIMEIFDAPSCPDGNHDGLVDVSDLGLYAQSMQTCQGNAAYNPLFDLNQNGCVENSHSLDFLCFKKYQTAGSCNPTIACSCGHGNADLNLDGLVDLSDLGLFAESVGKCAGAEGFNAQADLNGDGCVNGTDSVDLYCFSQAQLNQPTATARPTALAVQEQATPTTTATPLPTATILPTATPYWAPTSAYSPNTGPSASTQEYGLANTVLAIPQPTTADIPSPTEKVQADWHEIQVKSAAFNLPIKTALTKKLDPASITAQARYPTPAKSAMPAGYELIVFAGAALAVTGYFISRAPPAAPTQVKPLRIRKRNN